MKISIRKACVVLHVEFSAPRAACATMQNRVNSDHLDAPLVKRRASHPSPQPTSSTRPGATRATASTMARSVASLRLTMLPVRIASLTARR